MREQGYRATYLLAVHAFMPRAWLRARSGVGTLDEAAALAVKARPS